MKSWAFILLASCRLAAQQDGGFLTDNDFDSLSRRDQLTLLPKAPFAAMIRGEFMRGEFLGFSNKGVRWRHASVVEEFHLKTKNVRFLELAPGALPAKSDCEIHLTSGEKLHGILASMDGRFAQINSSILGHVRIPYAHLDQLLVYPVDGPALIEEIGDKNDWTFLRPPHKPDDGILERLLEQKVDRWTLNNNELHCDGLNGLAVARIVPSDPDTIQLEATLLSHKDPPELSIHMFADRLDDWRGGNNLALLLKKGTVAPKLYPQIQEAKVQLGKSTPIPVAANGRYLVRIFADRTESAIRLEINGELVGQWKQGKALKGNGAGIIFVSRGKTAIRISEFKISKTTHRAANDTTDEAERPKQGVTFALTNGDHLTGQLLGFQDKLFSCKTEFATIPLNPKLVSKILFPKPQSPVKLARPGAVSLLLHNRDRLTGTFESLEPTGINIQHPTLGSLKLSMETLHVVDFHRHNTGTTVHPLFRPAKSGNKGAKRNRARFGKMGLPEPVPPLGQPLMDP